MTFDFLFPIIGWLILFGIFFLIYSKMFYVQKNPTQHIPGQTLYATLSSFFWITLYLCLSSIWSIFYSLIDLKFPDLVAAAQNYSNGLTTAGIVYDTFAFPLAMILVSAVTAIILASFLVYKLQQNKNLRSERLHLFIQFLVYIGGAVMIFSGFIYVVYSWFYGNLPVAVFLKALVAVIIVGMVALYFYLVQTKPEKETFFSKIFAGILLLVTLATLFISFSIVGTPAQARSFRLDSITLQNLQNVKQQIDNQDTSFGNRIKTLGDITDEYTKNAIQNTPMTYSATATDYTLCAYFSGDMPQTINIPGRDTTWDYKAGNSCFTFPILPTNVNNFPKPAPIVR